MVQRDLRVTTASGIVAGFAQAGVTRWRSIPYAKPPIGRLRLRAPEPAAPWRGVRNCHEFGFCAPQQRRYTMVGVNRYQPTSEDCLTVNVVAPATVQDEPLPVMFFVHGGGYILGSSATPLYDGASMVRQGCVYLSVNYRLGALGCVDLSSLSTPENSVDSNLFLRDLVLALQWVRDNIAAFGGDPDNVTIFGESAGGHAVVTLLAVPTAAGLFTRVISESPSSGMVRSPEAAAAVAEEFVGLLGATAGDGAGTVMRAEPAQLVAAFDSWVDRAVRDKPGSFAVGATVDGDFLPRHPIEAMTSGHAHPVPMIVGHNAEEGRLFSRLMKVLPMGETPIEQLLGGIEPAASQRIRSAYPYYPRRRACIQLAGDMCFASAAWQIADAHRRHAPTYLYRYDYAPRILNWVGLVFDAYRTRLGSLFTVAADRRSALRLSDDIQRRWRSFSRTGVPGDGWPIYCDHDRAVMVFDRCSRIEHDPHPARRQAWETHSLTR
jgi:para-nitrobenzyl esterase